MEGTIFYTYNTNTQRKKVHIVWRAIAMFVSLSNAGVRRHYRCIIFFFSSFSVSLLFFV